MGNQGGGDSQQGGGWRSGVGEAMAGRLGTPTLHADNREEQQESQTDCVIQGSTSGK